MLNCSIMASCWCMGWSIHCLRDILAYDFVYVCPYAHVMQAHTMNEGWSSSGKRHMRYVCTYNTYVVRVCVCMCMYEHTP